MTSDGFRRLALSLPEAFEAGHMGHPDFRVGGRIFATLGYPDGRWGMVKLTPEQQEAFVAADKGAFAPVEGAWGRRGATSVRLKNAKAKTLRTALTVAWRNVAPRRLAKDVGVR
ncbi:MAG TPA: MmcQ/YjbR family DNA-binding protein [Vicinamibacteria bacterium]|nr:MmcQ/YjbR family DNA-binding protein [Vicinamibacteria bacterium]